jgi:hypothetical protein
MFALPEKENCQKNKRQAMNWEEKFTDQISTAGLVYKIYKEFSKLNKKKIIQLKVYKSFE